MRKFVEDLVAVAVLVGTEAWFLHGYFSGSPEFEPAIAFIAALGVVVAKEPVRTHFSSSNTNTSHDKNLFDQFLHVFPPESTTRFFREQNFGDSFQRSNIAPLNEFLETWESVEKEFIDKSLEEKRKALYAAALELASEISGRTVPLQGGQLVSVYSDQQRAAGPRPESVIEDARVLNEKASSFLPVYEDFIRSCRLKLNE
jgi:hypothetical protein